MLAQSRETDTYYIDNIVEKHLPGIVLSHCLLGERVERRGESLNWILEDCLSDTEPTTPRE
jgi:hypothetical protein